MMLTDKRKLRPDRSNPEQLVLENQCAHRCLCRTFEVRDASDPKILLLVPLGELAETLIFCKLRAFEYT